MEAILPFVAGAVALGSFYFLYYATGGRYVGADDDWWNPLRRATIPYLHDEMQKVNDKLYATNTVFEEEYVATLEGDYEDVAQWLEDMGLDRSPLAGLKNRGTDEEPDYEIASWAHREGRMADKQTHVILFRNEDGTFDVYAHREYSSINPFVAYKHYRGVDMSAEDGVQHTRTLMAEHVTDTVTILEGTEKWRDDG